MRSAPVGRSAVIVARAVFTVMVWASIAPGSADASCSHYVRSRNALPAYELSFADLGNADVAKKMSESSTPARRRACSGALCSGEPGCPSVPMHVDPHRSVQWAIISTPALMAVPGPAFFSPDENVPLPSDCSTAVYHPPRRLPSLRAL
jgi:hypothetical protein